MLDVEWSELLVIAIVAIIMVGPKDLPNDDGALADIPDRPANVPKGDITRHCRGM
jgi:hypothetical protein